MLLTRELSQDKRLTQTENERAGNKFFKQMDRKIKAGVAILISDKIGFQRRSIKKDPEAHFIIFKGRIHQEDIHIVNI